MEYRCTQVEIELITISIPAVKLSKRNPQEISIEDEIIQANNLK